MTVEYTLKTSQKWFDIKYSFGSRPMRVLVRRADITAYVESEMYDGGMRLVPATSLFLNSGPLIVPVPLRELLGEG